MLETSETAMRLANADQLARATSVLVANVKGISIDSRGTKAISSRGVRARRSRAAGQPIHSFVGNK